MTKKQNKTIDKVMGERIILYLLAIQIFLVFFILFNQFLPFTFFQNIDLLLFNIPIFYFFLIIASMFAQTITNIYIIYKMRKKEEFLPKSEKLTKMFSYYYKNLSFKKRLIYYSFFEIS